MRKINPIPELTKHDTRRFWRQFDPTVLTDECWTNGITVGGYTTFYIDGTAYYRHKVAYKLVYGELPESKPLVCHSCNNKPCFNPKHLYAGDDTDNARDREMAKAKEC